MLSVLIEQYLYNKENFNCRSIYTKLLWNANKMISSGADKPILKKITADYDVFRTEEYFLELIKESEISEKFNVTEINEELLDKISLWEYRNGCYESAREFLYFREYFAEHINFPYTIEYSVDRDDYYTKEKSPDGSPVLSVGELEDFCVEFLNNIK